MKPKVDSLESLVNPVLALLTERQQQVTRFRWGLHDGQQRTLMETGVAIGVSAERVRQIESQVFKRLRHSPNVRRRMQPLVDLIARLIKEAGGIVTMSDLVDALREAIPEGNMNAAGVVACVLVCGWRNKHPRFPTVGNHRKNHPFLVGDAEARRYPLYAVHVACEAREILKREGIPLRLDEIARRVAARIVELVEIIGTESVHEFIIHCLHLGIGRMTIADGRCWMPGWQRRPMIHAALVLDEAGEPLHYKEIAARVAERLEQVVKVRPYSLHKQLQDHPRLFQPRGDGVFTRENHRL
jgi:hypothetical protein